MSASLVIWWWGPHVRILGTDARIVGRDLGPAEDPVGAILEMIDQEFPGKGRTRIVYQPDSLEMHEVGCPKTDRARLRKILAADFPALDVPAAAWSTEPIRAGRNGYFTVLHLDPRPGLTPLVEGLARRGLRTEGAWPLLSLLESVPAGEGAWGSLSMVATARRVFIAGSSPGGDRLVSSLQCHDISGTEHALRHALARFEDGARPPGWLVLEDGAPTAFREAAACFAPSEIGVADFLGRARLLQPGAVSDLMPKGRLSRSPRTDRRLAAALAIVLVSGGALAIGAFERHRERSRQHSVEEEVRRRELDGRLASERVLRGRAAELAEAIARAESPPQPHYNLLLALASSVPEAMALQSLAIEGPDFVITGRTDPGAGRDPLTQFGRDLAVSGAPWRLQSGPIPGAGNEFTLRGSFTKPDLSREPPPAQDGAEIARLEARLAAVCASLPTLSSIGQKIKSWEGGWVIEARSIEPFSKIEVRHYMFTARDPKLSAWEGVAETVKNLCDEPGLTIERLALSAEPDQPGGRLDAAIAVAVRLRP